MSKVVVINHLTLDGVMQAPGRPDEDTRDGFAHGGWAIDGNDEVMADVLGASMTGGPLLLGRRTYEDLHGYWPKKGDHPFTAALDNARKYVASTTLAEPLAWRNSTLLSGDVPAAVARLRAQPGTDIVILGSGELVRSLARHDLVDEYLLMIHPLILGAGRRMFADDGDRATLELVESTTTTKGVVICRYRPRSQSGG